MSISSTKMIQLLLVTTSTGAVVLIDPATGQHFQVLTPGIPLQSRADAQAPIDFLKNLILGAREVET